MHAKLVPLLAAEKENNPLLESIYQARDMPMPRPISHVSPISSPTPCPHPTSRSISRQARDMLTKHSQWIIGGDGWAYDIGELNSRAE